MTTLMSRVALKVGQSARHIHIHGIGISHSAFMKQSTGSSAWLIRANFTTASLPSWPTSSFWKCNHSWRRARLNTLRCLIGCSIGDLSTMWWLMSAHPEIGMGSAMTLSMIAGISTSIALETGLLTFGKDGLPPRVALSTACGMSLSSMAAMELTENLVTVAMLEEGMSPATGGFWLVSLASMIAGYLVPLPYNYFRLKKWGKACH